MQSNSLATIQKLNRIALVITKIVWILCIIGLCASLIGAISLLAVAEDSELAKLIFDEGESKGEAIAELFSQAIIVAAGIWLADLAKKYFEHELAAGTPFTYEGADEMKRLGWRVILVNLGALIAAEIVYLILSLILSVEGNLNADGSIDLALGISMLILSLVYRYGADLRRVSEPAAEPTIEVEL